jgi:hypothetical protein
MGRARRMPNRTLLRRRTTAVADAYGGAKAGCVSMSPRVERRRTGKSALAVGLLLTLSGCASIGDLGELRQSFVTDDIHAWVGQEAATHAGAPISLNNLTDDERALRDLAFPLIEPPYDRRRWDAVLYEYGVKYQFQRALWTPDPVAYYRHLQAAGFRSTAGRYNRLIDDIRNDAVRLGPFFDIARRVVELDRRRQLSMDYLADVGPQARLNAQARMGENTLTIAWVQYSLAQRCGAYRFALDHLVVAEPENLAAQADVALSLLQQQVAANQLVPALRHAAVAGPPLAVPPAPVLR